MTETTVAQAVKPDRRQWLVWVVSGVVAVIAVVGLALALGARSNVSTLRTELRSAKATLNTTSATLKTTNATLNSTGAQLKLALAALQSVKSAPKGASLTTLSSQVASVQTLFNHVTYCLPELDTALQGEGINLENTNGYVTGGYLTNTYQISRFCSTVLNQSTLNSTP
jgi:hypothetical protein